MQRKNHSFMSNESTTVTINPTDNGWQYATGEIPISMTNDFQPRVFIGDNRLGAIFRTRLAVLILLEEKSAGHIVEVVGENVRFRIERLV